MTAVASNPASLPALYFQSTSRSSVTGPRATPVPKASWRTSGQSSAATENCAAANKAASTRTALNSKRSFIQLQIIVLAQLDGIELAGPLLGRRGRQLGQLVAGHSTLIKCTRQ